MRLDFDAEALGIVSGLRAGWVQDGEFAGREYVVRCDCGSASLALSEEALKEANFPIETDTAHLVWQMHEERFPACLHRDRWLKEKGGAFVRAAAFNKLVEERSRPCDKCSGTGHFHTHLALGVEIVPVTEPCPGCNGRGRVPA